ncbi:MAG: hypothetical protein HOB05_12775 [Bacteroidetes bacterium]|nr:hypothetical protein [Bacteroidota bacterium]
MLVFITCVKNPVNSVSYENVWRLLNNTLYSICSQQDPDFRVIVVCDKVLPLFHHENLINTYTEFVKVDFPSHGEEVINDFNRLGNLSPPLDNPKWWKIQNDYITSIELKNSGNRSFLLKFLKNLAGQRVYKKLQRTKLQFQLWWKDKKKFKPIRSRDNENIANVVLNKGSKLLVGILAARKYNPDYVMFFDADDYVGKDISAYVNSHPGENGWIMAHGYKMSGKKIAPYFGWNSISRTGNIFKFSILMEFVGQGVFEKSSQNELFNHVDSELIISIGKMDRARSFFEERGHQLLQYPTRSAIQVVGNNESSEYTNRITFGEIFDDTLGNSQRVGEITTISSTLVDYFNVLPDNSIKVFCLGFQKTGTTSVDWVLADMGYHVAKAYKQPDAKFSKMLERGDYLELKHVTKLFDAFQDIPWFLYYKEFDQWYPDSKFILTIRESLSWWKSFSRYFRTESYPLFEYAYGFENPIGNKEALIERYENHNRDVIEYFKDRQDDLLVIDVSENNTLQKISAFLGKSSSYETMPHKNASLGKPTEDKKKSLIKQFGKLKKLKQISVSSRTKLSTFSAPPIIISGSRKSGVRLMVSMLSCHPNIHEVLNVKLNPPIRHPLTPEADRHRKFDLTIHNDTTSPIDLKFLHQKLLMNKISLSAKRWCGGSRLGILAYNRLLAYYGENIRILNMVRDGRDVVTEYDKRVMEKYVVDSERWVYDVKLGVDVKDSPQVLTIRYEDLINDYDRTINRVCEFIGEKDVTPLLNYPRGATFIESGYWIGKWQQPQYSDRIEHLLQTPGALEYLQYYGYTQ